MEAVNKVINTASNAIWGESSTQAQDAAAQQHDEPISGVQGKGAASDPYDAGNREEQPNAPATDANTAPQDPKLDGQPKNASSADAVTGSTTDKSIPNLATATAGSATSTSPSASSSTDSSSAATSASSSQNREQRSGQNSSKSESDRVQAVMEQHHVSKEALQGPQGPAPRPAGDFEKDLGKVSKDLQDRDSGAAAQGGEKAHHGGGGNGKTSPMSKMKETLNKVTHPRHGK